MTKDEILLVKIYEKTKADLILLAKHEKMWNCYNHTIVDPDFEFVYPTVTDPDDDEQADAELNQQDGIALMASNSSADRNLSGFSALAGGYISGPGEEAADPEPTGLGSLASFWTSSVGEDGPIFINLDAEQPGIQKFSYEGGGSPGLSIRCVKDQE